MDNLSKKIIAPLVANGNITKENEAVYQYAVKSILILGLNILLSLLIGFGIGMPGYCILFLCALIPLRSDAGGYHAPNMIVCYLLSFASLILTLLWVKEVHMYQSVIMAIVTCVSYVLIFVFAPLESKNRPLREYEKICIRKRARFIVSVELIIGLVLLFVWPQAAYTVWSAIVWSTVGYVAWFIEAKFVTIQKSK